MGVILSEQANSTSNVVQMSSACAQSCKDVIQWNWLTLVHSFIWSCILFMTWQFRQKEFQVRTIEVTWFLKTSLWYGRNQITYIVHTWNSFVHSQVMKRRQGNSGVCSSSELMKRIQGNSGVCSSSELMKRRQGNSGVCSSSELMKRRQGNSGVCSSSELMKRIQGNSGVCSSSELMRVYFL